MRFSWMVFSMGTLLLAACGAGEPMDTHGVSGATSGGSGQAGGGGTGRSTGTGGASAVPNVCVVSCGAQHPAGRSTYNFMASQCLGLDCTQTGCRDKQGPSDECLPCVQQALASTLCHSEGFFGSCLEDLECVKYIGCLEACDAGDDGGSGVPEVPNACAHACGVANVIGQEQFGELAASCACAGCSTRCAQSVCGRGETPSDECLPCVQDALKSHLCHSGQILGAKCLSVGYNPDAACAKYAVCLEACQ